MRRRETTVRRGDASTLTEGNAGPRDRRKMYKTMRAPDRSPDLLSPRRRPRRKKFQPEEILP
jgi:hypothetical protein